LICAATGEAFILNYACCELICRPHGRRRNCRDISSAQSSMDLPTPNRSLLMAAEKKKPDTKKSRDKNMDGDIAKSKTESPPAAEKKESGKKTNSKKTNNKKTTKKEALSNSSSPTLKKNGALDDIQQQQAQS